MAFYGGYQDSLRETQFSTHAFQLADVEMVHCNRRLTTLYSGPSMIILRRVRAPRSGFDEYQHIIGFVYLGMQEIEIQPHEPPTVDGNP